MIEQPDSETSKVWSHLIREQGDPQGFHYRGTYPDDKEGVTVMLETWDAGSHEMPHCHPGDDMTVLVEGDMAVQFYRQEGEDLIKEGDEHLYLHGQTAYIRAKQIHSARYINPCKLVYVHDKAFDFIEVNLSVVD